ncbi:uncharacterized protein LOC105394415 [Plutella xylostella]|uniref:uncharacterized protein LOC105394415 n=1 Tax=Plutella xylostella TaxID=51655 RepID=UPI0020324F00|nr:uncharacterized protein LOC105394415 [Plutella xylostella]
MEQWESLIESYPREATLQDFVKAVETAEAVAKEDLAPFESDRFIRTLLSAPVDLILSVRRHHHEDVWSSTVVRCFSLVEALGERLQDYQEDLFKISQLPHSAAGRRRALLAVRALAPWLGPALASHWPALLHAAQYADDAVTVRAARAQLVGTICEYHPELLQNETGIKVWRIFLCTLEAAKTTDSLTNAVLTALDGLLRSCGRDLPTAELNQFYDTLAQEYVYICSCRDACLKLLTNHSNLFPERLAQDLRLRTHLWNEIPNVSLAAEAITSVYLAATNANNVESMAVQEVYPRTVSSSALVKNTACCVLATMLNTYRDRLPGVGDQFDRHVSSLCTSLEFSLSSKLDAFGDDDESRWEYDGELMNLIQQASWCIQTNVVGCDSLLRSIILLYRKIPAAQRKKYVVHTLLKAEPALRTCAITFLISETTKLENETSCIHKYFKIWEQIFDTNSGKDSVVMDNSKAVFEDFILYVLFAMEDFMENNFVGDFNQNTSQHLSTLLNFTSQILQLENVKDYVSEYIEIFLELVLDATEICLSDGQLLCLTSLVSAAEENCMFEDGSLSRVLVKRLMSFYENLQIDRCRDEGILCASCLTLMEAPDSLMKNVESTLTALLVIFSRDDVEPKTLSRALRKLETIILRDRCSSEESIICDIISKVDKIRSRKDISGKFAKILHRDVLLFMGKFGHKIDENNNIDSDKLMIVKLKEKLSLNIPNPSDGKSYKLNLESILDLALLHEDSKALHSLLLIISANLSSRPDPTLQTALSAVLHKLTRCHARGDTASAPPAAGCCSVDSVRDLITYIALERSPGVRALLALMLETVLLRDPHSEALRAVVEHAILMMGSQSSITKRAGLDLAETALAASKDNSSVVEYLPKLLNSILRTNETDFDITYEEATQCFAKTSVLFTQETLECTSKDLLETLTSVMFDELNLEKTVKLTVNTFKDIFSRTPETDKMVLELLKDTKMDALKYLLVLSEARKSFEFSAEVCAKIVSADNFKVFTVIKELLDGSLKRYTFEFCLKIVYKFMTECADAMLELKYVVTLELLNLAITKTTPVHVKKLHKHIEECIKSFAFIWKNTPRPVIDNFGTWCKNLPLKRITNNILKKTFVPDDAIIIYALKKMLKIFNLKQITSLLIPETCELMQRWPKELLKLFKSNYIQDFLKSKMAYLTDVLTVSLNFLKPAEVKGLILACQENSSNEKEGLKFCRFFVKSFAGYFLESNILMDVEMKGLCVLIHDVVKHFGRLECDGVICRKVVETVDQMWPTLESQLTLEKLCAILSDLQFLDTSDLQLSSNPGLWWLRMIPEVRNDDKVKLMAVLPVLLKNDVGSDVQEKYTAALQSYASTLPVLRSSLTAHAPAVSALLRGVAGAPPALLPLLPALPLSPPLPAWLSTALHACAAGIATHACALHAVRELCTRDARTDMFDALLLPVVRYSSTKACEDFFCATMNSILSDLWPKSKSSNNFIQYAKAFALAQLAFEKLPLSTLQSPTSPLYANLDLRGSKTLAAAICKICKTLRDGVAPGSDVEAYRWGGGNLFEY